VCSSDLDLIQEKIKKKIYNTKKTERIINKASNYLVANLNKCDEENFENIKLLFLEVFNLNDKIACEYNINSDNLLNLNVDIKPIILYLEKAGLKS
jgi:hypothetical protein